MSSVNEHSILPTLGFNLLKDAEQFYREHKTLSDEVLMSLHSVFGNVFLKALDLLDNSRFVVYKTENNLRKVMKISGSKENFFLFSDICFCHCNAFKYQVLVSKKAFLCKHILAFKLAQITQNFKTEIVTMVDLKTLLDDQLYGIL